MAAYLSGCTIYIYIYSIICMKWILDIALMSWTFYLTNEDVLQYFYIFLSFWILIIAAESFRKNY